MRQILLAAAAATLLELGCPLTQLAEFTEQVPCVPGRLERIGRKTPAVFVDYAHTPDGLVKAQASLRKLSAGRLITVFGCGGDRDRGKRPLMGAAVAQAADVAVVTSDNPRSEAPEAIISEILPGMNGSAAVPRCRVLVEADRRRAIEIALNEARGNDVILIAGKGHEPYQEIAGVRHDFDDRLVCRNILGV